VIEATIPVKIESSLNLREHWRVRANRNTSHRAAAFFALQGLTFAPSERMQLLPCVITMTRIAPRELDDDNLAGGFKSVRDGIADWFGIDDADKRLRFQCKQEKGAPKFYAARIEIERGY
jgi:hypothetical protein